MESGSSEKIQLAIKQQGGIEVLTPAPEKLKSKYNLISQKLNY